MRKIIYYLPALCTILAVFILQNGWVKSIILLLLGISIIIAKKQRRNIEDDEIEYDERVNLNIRYWAFGFLVVTNAILIIYLLLVSQGIFLKILSMDFLIIYLIVTLMIALYIIPSLAKKF